MKLRNALVGVGLGMITGACTIQVQPEEGNANYGTPNSPGGSGSSVDINKLIEDACENTERCRGFDSPKSYDFCIEDSHRGIQDYTEAGFKQCAIDLTNCWANSDTYWKQCREVPMESICNYYMFDSCEGLLKYLD